VKLATAQAFGGRRVRVTDVAIALLDQDVREDAGPRPVMCEGFEENDAPRWADVLYGGPNRTLRYVETPEKMTAGTWTWVPTVEHASNGQSSAEDER
jgi:hypothetical protein